jgi:hypothetical protein
MGTNHRRATGHAYANDFLLNGIQTAVVICMADGCDHRGCHDGTFRIVYVFHDGSEEYFMEKLPLAFVLVEILIGGKNQSRSII